MFFVDANEQRRTQSTKKANIMSKIILANAPVSLILPVSPVAPSLILPVDVKSTNEIQLSSLAAYKVRLTEAFEARIEYQNQKVAGFAPDSKERENNTKLVRKFRNMLATASHDAIATVLLNASFDPSSILDKRRADSCMNEKAVVKAVNAACSIAKVKTLDLYDNAILRTMQVFESNGLFVMKSETKACCSSSGKVTDSKRNKLLIRTAKHYDSTTAGTQSSSTNRMLQAFDVIRAVKNAANETEFHLNHQNATTALLLACTY